jgi:aldehyde reductase
MPVFGLGTFLTREENTYDLLKATLDIGYRHFDTAIVYENHKQLGEGFAKIFAEGKYKREDIFIVSKVMPYKSEAVLPLLK